MANLWLRLFLLHEPSLRRICEVAACLHKGFLWQVKGRPPDQPRQQWQAESLAGVVTPPYQSSKQQWPKALRRWFAGLRQMLETVNDKLLNTFRLARERAHNLTGFQVRLAAKVGLHNFCIWFNQHLDRPLLAFSDLIE
jgi:hypothetical protein